MNKLNPLFEAISEIDDNVISETLDEKKRPIRIKALIIAAAAAALSLIVGFTYACQCRSGIYINDDFIAGYDLTVQEGMLLPSPEEMTGWGAVELGDASLGVSGVPEVGYHYYFKKSTLPSDLFEKFNIHPLINGNFAEETTDVYANAWLCETGDGMRAQNISFRYSLTDKETGIPVEFQIGCLYDPGEEQPDGGLIVTYRPDEASRYEVIGLNNGLKTVVSDYEWGNGMQATAGFCYGGISYFLTADIDLEGMKGILERLGVL